MGFLPSCKKPITVTLCSASFPDNSFLTELLRLRITHNTNSLPTVMERIKPGHN